MRDIIHRHNLLNGVAFSIVEFALIAALTGAYGTYYLLHHRLAMAATGWGIALNCLPVVVEGFLQLRERRVSGEKPGSFWDKAARAKHRKENPHMLRDTLALTLTTLIPFLGLIAAINDAMSSSKR
jgi:hypothetical protein